MEKEPIFGVNLDKCAMAEKVNRSMRGRIAGSYLSTVISISLVLLLVGVGSMLLVNAGTVSRYFKEHMQVSVVMKPEVSDEKAVALQEKISAMDFIGSTEFISKEQGEREMEEMLGESFLDVFETSPIPASIDVTLKAEYVHPDSLEIVKSALAAFQQVDEVVYQQSLIEALNANLARISLVLAVFISLLLFISFVLINNTVRLSVFSRRFTIHTMKLVGATRSFIRAPFLVQAVFQGLFSALLAISLLLAALFAIKSGFPQLFEIFSYQLLLVVMLIVLGSGIFICTMSTYFIVNKLVSLSRDELYS